MLSPMASNSFTRALWWALPFLLLVAVLSCATVFPDILEGLGIGALMQCVSSESTRMLCFLVEDLFDMAWCRRHGGCQKLRLESTT